MNALDFNDAPEQTSFTLIPKGTLAKVHMTLKPGGYDDPSQGWTGGYATQSESTGAVYLMAEFVILEGEYAKRKLWSNIGLYSPKGPEWGNMGRTFIRALLNASRNIKPDDMSPQAQAASLCFFSALKMGFEALNGRLQGHIDGLIVQAPDGIIDTPCLWENKALKNSSFNALKKHKLAASHPVYAAQIAVYQAYMGWHHNPALFTAINADTMEIYAEKVVFDAPLAQRMSDRAVKVISATQAGETLPRSTASKEHLSCKLCAYRERCWGGDQ